MSDAQNESTLLDLKTLKRSLERIRGMCGHPDPAEACRNILKETKRVLTNVFPGEMVSE